jgi:integrase/recombinase XerD
MKIFYKKERPLKPRYIDFPDNQGIEAAIAINLNLMDLSWPVFWQKASKQLQRRNYSKSTLLFYRQVLRQLSSFSKLNPAQITKEIIMSYFNEQIRKCTSSYWKGMCMSVIRTVFDKIGGLSLTSHFITPKKPQKLPDILSRNEVRQLLESCTTWRDQLLLGLLYGCGLKVGEACTLKWQDIDLANKKLIVTFARGTSLRELALPRDLLPVLTEGVKKCLPGDYIFQGAFPGKPLSERMAGNILKDTLKKTEIIKIVSCMTLRHTYAVHLLESGVNIRAVQELLGHEQVETTMQYQRSILPGQPGNRGIGAPILEPPDKLEYEKPSTITSLTLPFPNENTSQSNEFNQYLRTYFNDRIFSLRRFWKLNSS